MIIISIHEYYSFALRNVILQLLEMLINMWRDFELKRYIYTCMLLPCFVIWVEKNTYIALLCDLGI